MGQAAQAAVVSICMSTACTHLRRTERLRYTPLHLDLLAARAAGVHLAAACCRLAGQPVAAEKLPTGATLLVLALQQASSSCLSSRLGVTLQGWATGVLGVRT